MKRSIEEKFMIEALRQAKKAEAMDETPVGAVIVKDEKIIARGFNRRETKKNALLHAEMTAIDKACRKIGDWRLKGCDMYVTLEPCPMCGGAILNARIDNLYYGASDFKSGCCGSRINLFDEQLCNHLVSVKGGVLKTECTLMITNFFARLRHEKLMRKREEKRLKAEEASQNRESANGATDK